MSSVGDTVLQVTDLEKSFGGVVAASNINIGVTEGEVIGIIGANGAGKTTFINMVTGWLKPTSGEIRFLGQSIIGLPPRNITRLGICRSFQVPQVFLSETVFDNLRMAFAVSDDHGMDLLKSIDKPGRKDKIEEQLRRYSLIDYQYQIASELHQGIRKLLDIAMATVGKPEILLLDEPTSGISVEEKFGLMDLIMDVLKQDRTTVLFVEHDMDIVERYVSRVLAFYQGQIICDAPTAEALSDAKVQEFVIGKQHHRTDATATGQVNGDDHA
jgi:branched-chain amino acid transport system ATP-binding protein